MLVYPVKGIHKSLDTAFVEGGRYELDVAGEVFSAKAYLRTPYDPKALRVRA